MKKSVLDDKAKEMFRDDLMSLEQIGKKYNVSRQSVKVFLNKNGINTSRGQFFIICDNCGVRKYKPRNQIRGKVHKFCSGKCYFEFLNNPNYKESMQGQRLGRSEIEKKFGLFDFVIHHKDGNDLNNNLSNLVAFKSHSDHMKFHRFSPVKGLDCSTGEWVKMMK